MFGKVIATLTALMLSTSVAFADSYVIGTDGACENPDNPNNFFAKFKSDDDLYKQKGVVFFNQDWSCKVKRFYYLSEEGPFEGTCWGEDDDGDYHVNVELWLDYEHEELSVSFDGQEPIVFTEECSE
jgi:hypothetical protein